MRNNKMYQLYRMLDVKILWKQQQAKGDLRTGVGGGEVTLHIQQQQEAHGSEWNEQGGVWEETESEMLTGNQTTH